MPKNRLFLIAGLILIAGLAAMVFAPFLVSNGLRIWLRWQAHRQELKIELGKIDTPFLRPISIDRIHITNATAKQPRVDLRVEKAVLKPRLIRVLTGRADAVRALSMESLRGEIHRDFPGNEGQGIFSWPALQALLPTNFNIGNFDLRLESGPTVLLLHNASISGNQIESGSFSAGEFTIISPLFRQKFSQLRGATKWQEDRLTIGGIHLSRGLDLQSMTFDFSHLSKERGDLQFDLDVFGGKIRASISNEWHGQRSSWNLAGTATGISLAQTSQAFGFTDQIGGSLRACNFTFRGDPSNPIEGTASIWTEVSGLSWRDRAADVIMLGAIFYNRQIQLQQLYIKQRQNQLNISGEGAVPSKSTDWLNPDFRSDISGSISDLGQFASLFGAKPGDFAGTIAIDGTLNARERKIGGHVTAVGKSLSIFKRQIDQLTAKLNLKGTEFELEQFEIARKKDSLRLQGKIDMSHEHDYSGKIEGKIGDASEYFLLGRSASGGTAVPIQFNAQISSGSWDVHGAFSLPGSNPVNVAAKFPLKIGQDWKTFLAAPLDATIDFPAVFMASSPQFLHPAVFTEGILSGKISLTQTVQHPLVTGDVQLLNAKLQNAPLDFTQSSIRLIFSGDHATLDFFNAATKDADLSFRGDIDLRDSKNVVVRISSTTPLFDLTAAVPDCVRRMEIVPVDVTLAPTIEQLEFRGDLFGSNWKFTLKETGNGALGALANQPVREFHFCSETAPQGEAFKVGAHPRPQKSPTRPRKRGRSR